MPHKQSVSSASGVVDVLKRYGLKSSEEITDELLRVLYRLQDGEEQPQSFDNLHTIVDLEDIQGSDIDNSSAVKNKANAVQAIHNFKTCPDAWSEPAKIRKALEVEHSKDSKRRKRKSSEDDETYTDKGKGKKKAIIQPACNKGTCKDNPRCLNWLGQAQWEDSKYPSCRITAHDELKVTAQPKKLSKHLRNDGV